MVLATTACPAGPGDEAGADDSSTGSPPADTGDSTSEPATATTEPATATATSTTTTTTTTTADDTTTTTTTADTGSTDEGGVDEDRDGYPASVDCDDTDPQVHPDAPERCNGIDDDCDPVTVEDGVVSVDGQGSYGTIADALVAAAPGSEVRVCPGTYLESLTIDMDLALVSEQGPSSTIVDAMGLGPTVTVTGGEVRIAGLTLTGGSSLGLGGGLSITGTDPVTVQDCVITGNTSSDGAGIYGYVGAQLELVQTTIENNVGGIGGGVAFNGDGLTGSLTLTECTVQGNDADETGGGLFVADVPVVELTATSVVGNTSLDGGGLRVIASPVTLVDSTVQGNTATGTGGGLGLFPGALGVITSIDTDWGTGATDNAPDDVFVTGAGSWAGYGAGASFTCDGTGCS